ncbi:MAG TPA: LCP family protein [Clostridiaceae bacterium]|nr:LCP family protein [Clostridiaceae bacterium]
MKLHKLIFVTCAILFCVLFFDGLLILNRTDKKNFGQGNKNYESTENNGLGNQENGNGVDNRTIDFEQDESSIWDEEPVNLLVLGLDGDETRADAILLFNYGPSAGRLNILSIARDTRVIYKGKPMKTNALIGIGGERLIIKQVERMTGLKVDYYVTLNFEAFRKIIDVLGGVYVDVPMDMDYDDPVQNLHIHLRKGRQLLDGKKAEQYVRYRKGNNRNEGYDDGDLGRIKAQQALLKELIEQKLNWKYISKADEIFMILKDHMNTNIKIGDIRKYIGSAVNLKSEDVKVYTTPGKSVLINDIWYFIYNKKETRKLIDENFFK